MHRSLAFAALSTVALAAADASAQEPNPFKEMPPAPKVDDPMLAPAPPAKRMIASWGEAISLVRARSTDLATAYAEVRRAEAQSRIALAAILPQINGTANAPQHQIITKDVQAAGSGVQGATQGTVTLPQGDFVTANVTLQQSLVNVQAWHSIKTAHENERAQALAADETNREITQSVASALVSVVTAERVAELGRVGLRSALERRELTTRKKNLGVATGLDVVRADQDVASARATLVAGDESLRKAREALGLAVGIPEQVGVPPGVKIDDVVSSAARTCPALGDLRERADIAAAQKRLDVAERNVLDVELSFLPTLSASSTIATTTQGTAAVPTTWNVTAVLTVPIWDGGVKYGNLRNARALRDEAGFSLEAQTRAATVQIEQARRSVAVAEQSLDVAKQARDLAAQVDQLTQIAYRAGQGTSLELVVAASALRTAEIELALREFDVIQARLAALFALARCSGTT